MPGTQVRTMEARATITRRARISTNGSKRASIKPKKVSPEEMQAFMTHMMQNGLKVQKHGQSYIEMRLTDARRFLDIDAMLLDPLNRDVKSDHQPGVSGTVTMFCDELDRLSITSHVVADLQLIMYRHRR